MTDPLASRLEPSVPLHVAVDTWRTSRPAMSRRVATECVCDGPRIVADSDSDEDRYVAVLRHQIEPVHIAWDLAHGITLSRPQLAAQAIDGAGR